MDFTSLTVQALSGLASFAGSYGLAIVLLTVLIRLAMWPLNVSQQRNMKKMQSLSPKLKEIQNRYKSDPQMMQKKMMEFYKEHKFNPFGGCFPLLIQMPIFIMLYAALMSPQFIQAAGDQSFLFINRLDSTLRSHSGVAKDGNFGVEQHDTFATAKTAKVTFADGKTMDVKIDNPKKALNVQGDIEPGKTLDLKINLDSFHLKFSELDKTQSAEISIINNGTKEVESIKFTRRDNILIAEVPTVEAKTVFHYDVLALVLLFGFSMYLAQKIMMASNKQAAMDPTQQAMQQSMGNIMPIMITGTFFFFPIPAGVLVYLIVSNAIQVAQTFIVNKQIDAEEEAKKTNIDVTSVKGAKPAKVKKVNDVK